MWGASRGDAGAKPGAVRAARPACAAVSATQRPWRDRRAPATQRPDSGGPARDPRTAARLVADALMESGPTPGHARASKYHFGPGPVGDAW